MNFTSWSPSRLEDYRLCPHMAMHKHLKKTCTICYKGKLSGGFDGKPVMCSKGCGPVLKGAALERGTEIGDALDKYLLGKAKKPPKTITHPAILAMLPNVRQEVKQKKGAVQINLLLTRKWEVWKGEPWSPEVWLRGKLDYRMVDGTFASVIDWKTGGIDKRDGSIRAQAKYDDQLSLYKVVTLCELPAVQEVNSALCFLDVEPAPAGTHPSKLGLYQPMVQRERLHRKDLKKEQKRWEKKIAPMFLDDTFAPRAGEGCRFCPFAKGKGGPCPY